MMERPNLSEAFPAQADPQEAARTERQCRMEEAAASMAVQAFAMNAMYSSGYDGKQAYELMRGFRLAPWDIYDVMPMALEQLKDATHGQ